MTKIIVITLFLLTYNIKAKSENIKIESILKNIEQDYFVLIQNDRIDFLTKSSSFMPAIDDIEIRMRNTAFRFDRQRYTLRIEPRGFGESKASKNLYYTNLNFYKTKKELIINKLLLNRYMLVINLLYRQSMLELYKKMIVLYEDKIKVLKSKINSLNFDLNNLLDTEDDYTKLKFNNIERERSINRLKKEINTYLQNENFNSFDTTGFIGVEFIKNLINSTNFFLDTNNVYLRHDRTELELAERRFDLETAESRRYISYFQFAYDHEEMIDELEKKEEFENGSKKKKNYNTNRAFLMNVGIRIPFINVDRHDINRRKMTVLSARNNYKKLKNNLKKKIQKDTEDIKILVSQYEFLMARKNDVNAESSLKKYLEMDGIDPIVLLSIKEDIIKNDINKEKIKFDIFRNYIRIVNVTGQMSTRPLRNYLKINQEIISQ